MEKGKVVIASLSVTNILTKYFTPQKDDVTFSGHDQKPV